ncbi:hypothetical protein KR026_005149 [Drosophila bipectinata]|nr:hypothetical protein KR026_005149 [Drosophila bipectinata]
MSSSRIPKPIGYKRSELNLDEDQSVKRHGDGKNTAGVSLISMSMAEVEAKNEIVLEVKCEDSDNEEEEEEVDDNLSLFDLICLSSEAEEEVDENAFAIDEASLVDVMEAPEVEDNTSNDGEDQAAAQDAGQEDIEKVQLENIVSLCQNIRKRLEKISVQLKHRTEELDEQILAHKKERDLQKKKNL